MSGVLNLRLAAGQSRVTKMPYFGIRSGRFAYLYLDTVLTAKGVRWTPLDERPPGPEGRKAGASPAVAAAPQPVPAPPSTDAMGYRFA